MINWQPYVIAVLIGLLVGIERQRSHNKDKALGVRTLILLSLLGALAGGLDELWLRAIIATFSLGLVFLSYFAVVRSTDADRDRGLTTEFAAGILFFLGYLAHEQPAVSALLGPLLTLILFSKRQLHRFTRAIRSDELQSALLLLLAGVVVINLAPDRHLDPWGLFNPRHFGFIVLTLAVLEFAGYLLIKFLGENRGTLVTGFLGGLVSSTAVMLANARNARQSPEKWPLLAISSLAAIGASLIANLVVVGLVSSELVMRVLAPTASALAIGGVALSLLRGKSPMDPTLIELKSPLDWKSILRLSTLLALSLVLVSTIKEWAGDAGFYATSFVAGLFELQGISLANATLLTSKKLSAELATNGIVVATLASLVSKMALAIFIVRGKFAGFMLSTLTLMVVVAGMIGYWL